MIMRKYSSKAATEKINDLLKIEHEAFGKYAHKYQLWELENFLYFLPDKEKLSILSYDNSKTNICGYLIGSSYGKSTHLNRIALLDDYRGKGNGGKMIESFLEKSRKNGFERTTLITPSLEENKNVELYKKFGYNTFSKREEIAEFLQKKNKATDIEIFMQRGQFIIMGQKL